MMLPPWWRQGAWQRLEEGLDVLVIGGGITGAGVLHDAAVRGLRAGLVERGDFACGTSSRSSKLVHGGLRYLKRMQLRITRTACRERDLLSRLNPHLVWPLRFLYPSFATDTTPGWQVNLGLTMYDHLTPVRHRHERITPAQVAALIPHLRRDGLEFGLTYDDAAGDDARLVLAVVQAAVLAGATALSYARVEALLRGKDGRVGGAVVRDEVTGETHAVRAHVVVNATGVWCDQLRRLLGEVEPRLRPSRGSHLLFPAHRLPLEAAVTALSPDDGRPVFAIPHPEGTLVGTTDVFHEGDLDAPRPSPEEVAYLMRFVATLFPACHLTVADVTGAFAGVRPILDSHAEEPSEASREEAVWEEEGLVSTAGGKLTTFRATAEEVVDEVVKRLPPDRAALALPCATGALALPHRADPAATVRLVVESGAPPAVAAGMVRRLGAQALPCALAASRRRLRPVAEGVDVSEAELEWHLRFGGVVHLEDLLLRRVRLGMWQPKRCLELAPRLGSLVRDAAGWGFRRWRQELYRLEDAVANWLPREPA